MLKILTSAITLVSLSRKKIKKQKESLDFQRSKNNLTVLLMTNLNPEIELTLITLLYMQQS